MTNHLRSAFHLVKVLRCTCACAAYHLRMIGSLGWVFTTSGFSVGGTSSFLAFLRRRSAGSTAGRGAGATSVQLPQRSQDRSWEQPLQLHAGVGELKVCCFCSTSAILAAPQNRRRWPSLHSSGFGVLQRERSHQFTQINFSNHVPGSLLTGTTASLFISNVYESPQKRKPG